MSVNRTVASTRSNSASSALIADRKRSVSATTASLSPMNGACSSPSSSTSLAPGIRAATYLACRMSWNRSSLRLITRVGTCIAGNTGLRSMLEPYRARSRGPCRGSRTDVCTGPRRAGAPGLARASETGRGCQTRTPRFPTSPRCRRRQACTCLVGPAPRVVRRRAVPREDGAQDERGDAVGVRRGEEAAECATVLETEQRGSLGAGSVHDGPDVVHAELERGRLGRGGPVGEPAAPPVEHDEPGEAGEAPQEVAEIGHLPDALEVRDPAGRVDEVEWALAGRLVRDVQAVDGLRVADAGLAHARVALRNEDEPAAGLARTRAGRAPPAPARAASSRSSPRCSRAGRGR